MSVLKKYPKLKYPNDSSVTDLWTGETIHVIEKLDGANFRFRVTDEGIVYGSRNVAFTEDGSPLPVEECNEQFRHAIRYIENFAEVPPNSERYTFFGEAMHTHSIDYDAWDGRHPNPSTYSPPNVVIFDAWDHREKEWVQWDELKALAVGMNLQVAPELDARDPKGFEEYQIPQSIFRTPDEDADNEFDRRGLAEGVVLRNPETGAKAKLVHEGFKETNAQVFEEPSQAQTDAGVFVAAYVTEARIEKQAHKLLDEAEYDSLKMEMMQDLPRLVLTDALAEEGWDLLNNDLELHLDEDCKGAIRSKASKKCARVLKSMCNSVSVP